MASQSRNDSDTQTYSLILQFLAGAVCLFFVLAIQTISTSPSDTRPERKLNENKAEKAHVESKSAVMTNADNSATDYKKLESTTTITQPLSKPKAQLNSSSLKSIPSTPLAETADKIKTLSEEDSPPTSLTSEIKSTPTANLKQTEKKDSGIDIHTSHAHTHKQPPLEEAPEIQTYKMYEKTPITKDNVLDRLPLFAAMPFYAIDASFDIATSATAAVLRLPYKIFFK